ncbi:peptidase M15 [Pseudoxanthomonas sp. SGD-10]|nr:peptidase M15 [Pseudoxanthomonas sp. SGD-10]
MQLTTNFTLAELTVTSTGLPNQPGAEELSNLRALANHILQPLRDALGKPVIVNSGYRSAAVNRAVGGAATSQHRTGEAADIVVKGMSPEALAREIVRLRLPFDQLIWEPTWVHVSYGRRHRRQTLRATRGATGMVYQAWKP